MKHCWQTLRTTMLCALLGAMVSSASAATDTISGKVIMLSASGDALQNITTPYVSGAFALIDVQLWDADTSSAHMLASYVLDTAVERAMLLGLISKLSTGEDASLSGEVVTHVCVVDRMDPVTSVTFN